MKNIAALLVCFTALTLGSTTIYAADGASMPQCKDGTTSTKTGKGACSHHGGVLKPGQAPSTAEASTNTPSTVTKTPKAKKPKATESSPAPATQASAPTTSTDTATGSPTAKCKDGTVSYSKHHKGTCSHHGGVAEWM